MRKLKLLVCLVSLLGAVRIGAAQETKNPLSGRWLITTDFHGTTIYFRLTLAQDGEKLTGDFDGDKLEGSVKGNSVHFLAKDDHGGSEEGNATLAGKTMSGSFVIVYGDNPNHPETHDFAAALTLVPQLWQVVRAISRPSRGKR